MSKIFLIIIIFMNIVPMGLGNMHIKINCTNMPNCNVCLKEEPSYIMVTLNPTVPINNKFLANASLINHGFGSHHTFLLE